MAKYGLCTKLIGKFFFGALCDAMKFFDLFDLKFYPIKFQAVTEDVFHLCLLFFILFARHFRNVSPALIL